jgi:predicted transcriptional regulator
MHNLTDPHFDHYTEKDPFEIIQRLTRKPGTNLTLIAYELGIGIQYLNLGPDIATKLKLHGERWNKKSYWKIYINLWTNFCTQRFSLAHSIAHYILHRDLADEIEDDLHYKSTQLKTLYEAQANKLAADILLPMDLIEIACRKNNDIKRIADMFGVSSRAIKIRMRQLKKPVSKTESVPLQINRYGFSMSPNDNRISLSCPKL